MLLQLTYHLYTNIHIKGNDPWIAFLWRGTAKRIGFVDVVGWKRSRYPIKTEVLGESTFTCSEKRLIDSETKSYDGTPLADAEGTKVTIRFHCEFVSGYGVRVKVLSGAELTSISLTEMRIFSPDAS